MLIPYLEKPAKGLANNIKQYYEPENEDDHTLVFESRFECGNLNYALKLSDNEYNILLQNDINTNGHTQWFYFRVGNTRKGSTVKFNLLNLVKPDSLYNYGMKILCLSEKLKKDKNIEWYRDGSEIYYYKNWFKREGIIGIEKCYYTLTFSYTFKYDHDYVYFAYSLPYSYTELCDDLTKIMSNEKMTSFVSRNVLWRTIAGNKCEYLTITSKENPDDPNKINK